MALTTLSEKGQVVIPAEVRRRAGLRPGDRFDVVVDDSGALIFRPLPRDPLLALRGAFGGKGHLTEDLLADRARERKRG
ncbi:MAG TPA: AbrB/MazE/SpoVT family DNA-binding domain-containing protein [Bacillota bacterium]|nr:AbrB/MazE/SpoVT family DNA-binding domain-containing protein [Bacillota bacterium]